MLGVAFYLLLEKSVTACDRTTISLWDLRYLASTYLLGNDTDTT